MNEKKHEKIVHEMMNEVRDLSWKNIAHKVSLVYEDILKF